MEHAFIGRLFVVASPSGGGKTSLVNALTQKFEHLDISISYTTRMPRPGEVDGNDYHFINEDIFQNMIANKEFLEHAEVYGCHYGTSHHWVLKQLKKGTDIVLEIDWQGARQIRQLFPSTVSIFILPPSRSILLERLEGRKQDSKEVIEKRMEEAISEMAHCHEFEYLVINDQFEKALEDLTHIVRAERLKCDRQRILKAELLDQLLASSSQ